MTQAKAILPETLKKDRIPDMTDTTETTTENTAYTEFSITVGLSTQQIILLEEIAPHVTIHELVLQGLQSLQELASANIPDDERALTDTMGIIQILRAEFEEADTPPIRIAVRYRESDEWRGTTLPALYTEDGAEFLKNPPAYGDGDGSGAWELAGK